LLDILDNFGDKTGELIVKLYIFIELHANSQDSLFLLLINFIIYCELLHHMEEVKIVVILCEVSHNRFLVDTRVNIYCEVIHNIIEYKA